MGGGGDTVIIRMFLGELNKQFTKKNHCPFFELEFGPNSKN